MSKRIERIRDLEAEADKYQEQADELRWEAARLIAEELAAGKSQRELAREIGKSQAHVSFMAATWNKRGANGRATRSPGNREDFNAAYQKAKKPQAEQTWQPSEEDLAEADADSTPDAERALRTAFWVFIDRGRVALEHCVGAETTDSDGELHALLIDAEEIIASTRSYLGG